MSRVTDWQGKARLPYGPHQVSEAELIAYAREIDPQPMHLDAKSEQARLVGGLIGSGWQTAAINHALVVKTLFAPGEVVALLGVPRLKWAAPARVGDVLSGEARLVRHRASRSHPGHSIVELDMYLMNQRGQVMLEVEERLLVRGAMPGAEDRRLRLPEPEVLPRDDTPARLGPVEDMPVGLVYPVGSHTFDAAFARSFVAKHDPLPGLIDPEAPGVSGWHAAARWLRQTIDLFNSLEQAGHALPQRGPGMGLKNVVWHKPVRPGDTLRYYSRVEAARRSASRPGWGILTLRNYAFNQRDEAVLAFTCFWLWGARKDAA